MRRQLPPRPEHALVRGLTPRQTEVARLIAMGYRIADVALMLDVKYPTIKTHIEHIVERLNWPKTKPMRMIREWASRHPDALRTS